MAQGIFFFENYLEWIGTNVLKTIDKPPDG